MTSPGRRAFARPRGGDDAYWERRIAGYWQRELHPHRALLERVIYVALDGGVVVGLVAGHLTTRHDCQGELQWIDVREDWQRRGVASGLLAAVARWFVAQGASRVCVDVASANAVVRQFYAQHGGRALTSHWLVWDDIGVVLARPG